MAGGEDVRKRASREALSRALAANAAALVAGTGVALLKGGPVAIAYAVGFALGAVNLLWLFRIVTRGMGLPPEKVSRFVTARYYLRFAVTAFVFFALITRELVEPVPLLVGLTASVAVTMAALIHAARKEAQ